MSCKRVNKLDNPHISYLLYKDIHDFVKQKEENNHKSKILEQKLLYIIDALSLSFYGMPIFYARFYAKEKGPVERDMEKIQNKNINIEEEIKSNKYKNVSFAKFTANKLFKLTTQAINEGLIKFDADFLSELTHTEEWKKKYKNKRKYEEDEDNNNISEDKNEYFNEIKEEEIYNFATTTLKDSHPQFFKYIEERL
ncbi:type II toxin-antitoxin system antitoxin SocA domain-containing protein [uncultured Brachyspira sp.]|uniref:type II toxin-antitoxin system antitoxin SocA domain-containing protein n=1 Tax=uncultured Brachyspira sp. TaxID=221953 RepID=UPI00258F3C73|nr:type II toxin-antitoxin system antitoxin SocA domain-containing protein [uncultured Brachyspira sp.]